jgi:hypothetical protein
MEELGLLYTPRDKKQIFMMTRYGRKIIETLLEQMREQLQ